jgi:cobalt/nickel transport system permease protein
LHIPDGILDPAVCIALFIISTCFLAVAWWKVKNQHPRYFIALIAIVSALLLVIQIVEFPVAGGGSTWHFLGGTAVTMILGPWAGMISMTMTLGIQAAMGDGGLTTFGANIFNMAVIGALSFYIVKLFMIRGYSTKKLAVGMFIAAFTSNVCTALAVGLEIGLFPLVGNLGGVGVTVPTMLVWYVPTGLIEGLVSSALIVALSKLRGVNLFGLEMCRGNHKNNKKDSPKKADD